MTLTVAGRALLEELRKALRDEYRTGCLNRRGVPELMERWKKAVRELPDRREADRLRSVGRPLEGQTYVDSHGVARRQLLTEVGLSIGRLLGDAPQRPERAATPEIDSTGFQGEPNTPLQYMKGVGPKLAAVLGRLGLETASDLVDHFPRRWEDRTRVVTAREAQDGDTVVVEGVLGACESREVRRGLSLLTCPLHTSDGVVELAWFNQKWLARQLKAGEKAFAFGKVERKYLRPQMASPELEFIDPKFNWAGRWVPVYPATARLSQKWLRTMIFEAVKGLAPRLSEPIPKELLLRRALLSRADAVYAYHFPDDPALSAEARRRLAYEELFLLQVEIAQQRQTRELEPRRTCYRPEAMEAAEFFPNLPFKPTGAQMRVAREIVEDLQKPVPMNRLLQGDVGSGKTAVAAFAAWAALRQGYQAAIMAPTEILAEQHFQKLGPLLEPMGIRMGFLSGSVRKRQKDEVKRQLQNHEIDFVVGTHALLQPDVEFARLSLVVVDEQHKFGVMQRTVLRQKGFKSNPDLLVMTATPIPRTLALTVHGELEVSRLDEMPPGRQPIHSEYVPFSQRRRIYNEIRSEVEAGRQAYIVCPLIEDSETLEASSAVEEFKVLESQVFPEFRVGLLHGKMKALEKEQIMQKFRTGEFQILVSTTVIEVGVDVPNATVMLVQDANRFGLSQLHQLRGRVGRGAHASRCIFMADTKSQDGKRRLKAIAELSDGFEVAEEDLQIRGPGDYYGLRQSGFPEFKVADLTRDFLLVEQAKEDARWLLAADPDLRGNPALKDALRLRAERTAELVH